MRKTHDQSEPVEVPNERASFRHEHGRKGVSSEGASRNGELDFQANLHETAIERARKCTEAEIQRTAEYAVQIAEETRLTMLSRERTQAEQEERTAIIARIEVERRLVNQLAARVEQEKIERTQATLRAASEMQLNLILAEREEHERQLLTEEKAKQARLHEAAIENARLRAAEEIRQKDIYAARIEEESRLASLAREQVQADQVALVALSARIEIERRLTEQIEATTEQQRIERAQTTRRIEHEQRLRAAAAGREALERQLQIEEQAALAKSHESAIAEASKRAAEEIRRTEECTTQMDEEARLEALARQRSQAVQRERQAVAARIETERQLAARIEARIEQEKTEREQLVQKAESEKKLRVSVAKREILERQLQADQLAVQAQRHEVINTAAIQPARVASAGRGDFFSHIFANVGRPHPGYIALALLGIGVAVLMTVGMPFLNHKYEVIFGSAERGASVPATLAVVDPPILSSEALQHTKEEIHKTVMQWADAWSRRDTAAYLAFYAADFNIPNGMQRVEWEAQRKLKLRKYRSIEVTIKNMEIRYYGGDNASVRFVQDFRADRYREKGTPKELRLRNEQGRWLIADEKNS